MKRLATVTALASLLAAPVASAEGWTFLAGTKEGYTAEPAVSLMLGQMSPDSGNASASSIAGLELSLNCPLLQPPSNRIRQQVSLTRYDDSGFKMTNIEINPHYIVEVAPGLEVGGGPGLGYIITDGKDKNPGLFGLQLGLSAHYTGKGPFFVGAEWRYQFTTEGDFGADGKTDLNNSRVALKLGYAL